MAELKRSPLHDRHQALGARFAEFGGWSMPLQYAGIVSEHKAVREAVGIFDVQPPPARPGSRTRCRRLPGRLHQQRRAQDRRRPSAQYTLLCNTEGGVVDDLIWYWLADDEISLIPSAANTAEVVALLAAAAPEGITVTNEHDDHAVLAVQDRPPTRRWPRSGCRSATTTCASRPALRRRRADRVPHRLHRRARLRTGGAPGRRRESGTPCWPPASSTASPLPGWARDTLRTEMGYPLHGQDLRLDLSAGQCGVGWAIGWKKDRFWGDEALRAEGRRPGQAADRAGGAGTRHPASAHGGRARRRRGRRGHLRHLLADARQGHRAGVAAARPGPRHRRGRPGAEPGGALRGGQTAVRHPGGADA